MTVLILKSGVEQVADIDQQFILRWKLLEFRPSIISHVLYLLANCKRVEREDLSYVVLRLFVLYEQLGRQSICNYDSNGAGGGSLHTLSVRDQILAENTESHGCVSENFVFPVFIRVLHRSEVKRDLTSGLDVRDHSLVNVLLDVLLGVGVLLWNFRRVKLVPE